MFLLSLKCDSSTFLQGGIKSKSSSNSDMSKNNAMTGASSSRAAAPPNNPPGELRLNTEMANTPVGIVVLNSSKPAILVLLASHSLETYVYCSLPFHSFFCRHFSL